MTAVIGDRSVQEEEADGGNISIIMLMLMECTGKKNKVPMDELQAASPLYDTGQPEDQLYMSYISCMMS